MIKKKIALHQIIQKIKTLGKRTIKLTKELWIDREDFMEVPVDKYFRLSPGAQVRLRYGFVIECTGFEKDVRW